MKHFIVRILLAWALIVCAFWIGSGFESIPNWEKEYRYIMVTLLVFSFAPVSMSVDLMENKK